MNILGADNSVKIHNFQASPVMHRTTSGHLEKKNFPKWKNIADRGEFDMHVEDISKFCLIFTYTCIWELLVHKYVGVQNVLSLITGMN